MLRRLSITNYALIDHLEVELHEGLSIITGETGAGKSIILGALSLLLGQRADVKSMRDTSKKSVIEAVFGIGDYNISSFFEENDIDWMGDECIVRREILPNGRNRAFINDTPVSITLLSAFTIRLIDIHSQHSNALLLAPAYQLTVVDNLSSNQNLRNDYSEAFRVYSKLVSELEDTKRRIAKNKSDEEYFRFQLDQFMDLGLKVDEQEELETAQNYLSNISTIKEKLWTASSLLGDDNKAIVSNLSAVVRQLDSIANVFPLASELSERVDSMLIEAKDIYATVADEVEKLEDDPSELEKIENRLNAIYSLQQRYHVDSVAELLDIQHGLEKSLSEIENADSEISDLEKKVAASKLKVAELADRLTAVRRSAANLFTEKLVAIAAPLGMKNLLAIVDFQTVPYEKTGQDKVRFLFAFNKNQTPMPVEKTASGGEISRLMLCIKSIIAEKMQLPSIIFDEVDTGVSGEVANKIGVMMRSIAKKIQVITITHLPQVAAMGSHHYKVYKRDTESGTLTNIKELDGNERVLEIAGMLSGSKVDDAAINNAKSLLDNTTV